MKSSVVLVFINFRRYWSARHFEVWAQNYSLTTLLLIPTLFKGCTCTCEIISSLVGGQVLAEGSMGDWTVGLHVKMTLLQDQLKLPFR
jgi:hypothetical protein